MKLYEPLMLIPSNGVYETRVYVGSAPGTVIPETSLRSPSHSVGPSRSKPRAAMPPESQSPERYLGLTNIGIRPTVGERNALTIETHILDFDQMIYGLDITVDFISRIRDERKFSSLQDLRLQLLSDAALVRRF
jgi:FAD synthase